MKNIEVFVDEKMNMLIKVDDTHIELTSEEAAFLDSQMSAAYETFEIRNDPDVDPPGAPLTKIRPVQARGF